VLAQPDTHSMIPGRLTSMPRRTIVSTDGAVGYLSAAEWTISGGSRNYLTRSDLFLNR
jgi:hypothetical protein